MINRNQIIALAEEALEGTDRFVVDVLIKNDDVILVFLDADSTLTIDHCVEVSRHSESKLDREQQDYELRVSSAGLDQPISLLRQMRKNIGRSFDFELNDGSKIKGKLTLVENNKLTVETFSTKKVSKIKKQEVGETIVLSFDQVKIARVIISFNEQKRQS
jgi:ribosome maturation factor RimP